MDGYFPVDSGRQKYGFYEAFLLGQSFIKLAWIHWRKTTVLLLYLICLRCLKKN